MVFFVNALDLLALVTLCPVVCSAGENKSAVSLSQVKISMANFKINLTNVCAEV